LILNQFEKGDVDDVIQKEPKIKKYYIRSRSNTPKVDIHVSTKKASTPVKSGISKYSHGIQIDQQLKKHIKVSTTELKETEKVVSSFSLEHEINKNKIPIPQGTFSDTINLEYENLSLTIGPQIEDRTNASPPFYISLNIHDKILHNFLMDSVASHNVMPKVVMDELGLYITKPYLDLYYFDSRKVILTWSLLFLSYL
jgi:hypothetical protein